MTKSMTKGGGRPFVMLFVMLYVMGLGMLVIMLEGREEPKQENALWFHFTASLDS